MHRCLASFYISLSMVSEVYVLRNVLKKFNRMFECASSHARVTTPPMMIRSIQVPALYAILLPQVLSLFSIFQMCLLIGMEEMNNPEPGVRFGKVKKI